MNWWIFSLRDGGGEGGRRSLWETEKSPKKLPIDKEKPQGMSFLTKTEIKALTGKALPDRLQNLSFCV